MTETLAALEDQIAALAHSRTVDAPLAVLTGTWRYDATGPGATVAGADAGALQLNPGSSHQGKKSGMSVLTLFG